MEAATRDTQLLKTSSSGTSPINQVRVRLPMARAELMQTVSHVTAVARQAMHQPNVGSRMPPATSVRRRAISPLCVDPRHQIRNLPPNVRMIPIIGWIYKYHRIVMTTLPSHTVIFHFQ